MNIQHFSFAAIIFLLFSASAKAQFFSTQEGKIDFYSKTPIENIEAHSNTCVVILNTKTRDVAFQLYNTSFEFPNKLMQEHFNEKYIESEKFPKSSFSGKINEVIDLTVDGTYDVTVTGNLNLHGVIQQRTVQGTVSIKGGVIHLISNFRIKVSDHKIEIPTLVVTKIAEEIAVTVDAIVKPKK